MIYMNPMKILRVERKDNITTNTVSSDLNAKYVTRHKRSLDHGKRFTSPGKYDSFEVVCP